MDFTSVKGFAMPWGVSHREQNPMRNGPSGAMEGGGCGSTKESVGINDVSIRGCVTKSHFHLAFRKFSLNPLSRIIRYFNLESAYISQRFKVLNENFKHIDREIIQDLNL